MNLVYRHPSGGSLWQGGKDSANSISTLRNAKIKAVVYAAIENQPKLPDNFDVLRARLYDDPFMGPFEAWQVARCADEVSDMLAAYITGGENVLASCWAGLNRSGLLSGMTMMRLTGMSADAAVARVRAARGPSALGNPIFVKILRRADIHRRRLAMPIRVQA